MCLGQAKTLIQYPNKVVWCSPNHGDTKTLKSHRTMLIKVVWSAADLNHDIYDQTSMIMDCKFMWYKV